ncbi:MAG: peptide ABC transporter substrate-binding protein [Alphaproteobacteria bacterium]
MAIGRRTAFALALVLGVAIGAPAAAQAQMVYHRGNTAEPETLDQHLTSTVYEAHILRDLYESLVVHGPEAEILPGAAASWSVSDDGLVYTFEIRDDARWSNGDDLTARDFVFSYRRILDPATGAKYANILYPIKGAEAVNKGEAAPESIGVRAVDTRTLEITLEAPMPYFLELLTHQTSLPVHPPSVDEHGMAFARPEHMVSNGAYTLVEWVPNAHIKLEKNAAFHAADEVAIDEVYYYPTEDRSAALRRFMAGELHSNDDAPVEQMDFMRERLGDQLRIAPYLGTYYYAVNMEDEALGDARVRRALSVAIDREFLAEEIWGDAMLPAYSFVPPGINNYDEPAYADYRDMAMFDREDEAMAILAEAGYGPDNPLEVEIRYNTSENHQRTATAIASMWQPLGVETTLHNTDTKTHYANLRDRGDFDIARAGWIGDYSDPQNFLFMVESDNVGFNYARYENSEYDALMDEAKAATDLEARAQILHRAEEVFMRDLPFIPLLYYSSINLVSDELVGWQDNLQNVHATRWMRIVE